MWDVYKMWTKAEIIEDDAEDYLYEFVNANSDFSVSDLSKRLGWSTEKVSHAIKKLEQNGSIGKDRSMEEERAQAKIHPIGWKRFLPNDVKDNAVGKFRGWLLKKGYARQTAIIYDMNMRRAEREHLTTESVGEIYWGCSHGTRTKLRSAVRMLEEYYG